MKILVIGHSVYDTIEENNTIKQGAGGIFYTVSALNKINLTEDEIFLCSCYDEESYKHFKTEFSKVNISLLTKVEKIPRVKLKLSAGNERVEEYENLSQTLNLSITDYNKFDGILINMITGFDITLVQLQDIREKYNGLIFMDVHTLSRGLNEDGSRSFRVIPDFEHWAKCLDIIQVNQTESYALLPLNSEIEIATQILELGVKVFCITKGELGAKVYYLNEREISSYYIAAKSISQPVMVGCGDVFGSTFFYNYIRNKDARFSLYTAVKKAEQFVAGNF